MSDSVASEDASTFNNKVENACKEGYHQKIEAEKKKFEEKINGILKELGSMSQNSQQALTLFQQLAKLQPILSEIGAAVTSVDNDVYYQLYIKFRNIFKQFNSSAEECTKLSQQSLQGKLDPEKMKEIRNSISKVAEQLSSIQQNVYSETKRYIIWVDINDSKENKSILLRLQNQYQNSITVKFYSNINAFKAEFPQFTGQPLFLILSGQVANDYAPTDGRLFNWLKEQWNKDKIKTRIKGIVVFTSDIGVKYTKDKFITDPSKLVRCVTANIEEMVNTLGSMISPSKFCRLVGIEEFSHFFTNQMKDKLLNIHLEERAHKKLSSYHPDKIKLENIFKQADELVQNNKINFDTKAAKFDLVLKHLLEIYKQNQEESALAGALIHLYSREDVPFYKLINSSLNTMNERLLEVFYPVIEMFASAIFFYDDSSYPESIKKGFETQLFRGSSIPIENYNELCKVNSFVTLPAFSSFSPDIKVAVNFVGMNTFPDTKPCIFVYTQNMGNKQLLMRPKYITNHAYYKNEKEFITYPCICYKIAKITPKKYDNLEYEEIILVLN